MNDVAETVQDDEEEKILYGVDAWAEYLADKALPVRASSLKRLRRLLLDDNTMLHQITPVVKADPVLTLHVTRAAQTLHAGKDSHVTGVDHAVSSLGINKLMEIVGNTKAMKLNPHSVAQKQYFRMQSVSQHAAHQCLYLAETRKLPYADETHLAAMLYGFGFWMLWLHAPLHMDKIQRKVYDDSIDVVLAESDILGCSIQRIAFEVAKLWDLPELVQQALDHETSPSKVTLDKFHQRAMKDPRLTPNEIRELNHLSQERYFPVKISNWLTLTCSRGWYQTKTIRTIDIINDYLSAEIGETISQLHRNCARSSRCFHVPGTLPLAAEMLFIASDLIGNYCLGEKEKNLFKQRFPIPVKPKPPKREKPAVEETKTAEPEKPDYLDQNAYTQIVERFVKGYYLYTKPAHILQGLMQGLTQGLGLQRVSLNLINSNHRLKTAQSVGFPEDHLFRSFEADLEIPSLFKKLTEKPGCIHLNDGNRAKLAPMLPDNFKAWLPEHDCLLMSLHMKKRAIAIVYADTGESSSAIDDFIQDRFRYICSAATLALKNMNGNHKG